MFGRYMSKKNGLQLNLLIILLGNTRVSKKSIENSLKKPTRVQAACLVNIVDANSGAIHSVDFDDKGRWNCVALPCG